MAAGLPAMALAEEQKDYNVLFILCDQWRAQATGYAGDENAHTPNLDRFASENIVFTNAVSCQPVSSSARASLLSGQFPTTNGMIGNDLAFMPNDLTLGEVFKKSGYRTGYIGKWHLNGGSRTGFIPEDRRFGFDYWKVMNCTHRYNGSMYWGEVPVMCKWEGYDAFAQADSTIAYIERAAKSDSPFMMLLSWGPPHDPYHTAPEEYRKMYSDKSSISLRPNVPEKEHAKWRNVQAGYYAHIAALDKSFGDIVAKMDSLGLMDNTVIVFYSDHGDMLGSHGFEKKSRPFDESVKVPLLVHWPGISHKVIDEAITTPDLMPTLLDICGLDIPEKVQGRSFADIITGKEKPDDRGALYMWPVPRPGYKLPEYRAVRTVRYTYVETLDGPWLLFDNEKDPYQMENLVETGGHAREIRMLGKKLRKLLKEADDSFMPGEEYENKFHVKSTTK